MTIETMKVKPWGTGQGEFVLINKSDFNADVHERFETEPKKKAAPVAPAVVAKPVVPVAAVK